MTLEHLANHLRSLGYRVNLAFIHGDSNIDTAMLIIGHPYAKESAMVNSSLVSLMVTNDGRLVNPEQALSLVKLSHNFGLGVTHSGYLFPLNDIEGSVKEFLSNGILKELNAVVAFHGDETYLFPADMASAVPPQMSVRQVMAYEKPDSAAYITVYGPQLYRPLVFRRKAKNLFTKVNGNKPERVLADLWNKLLSG